MVGMFLAALVGWLAGGRGWWPGKAWRRYLWPLAAGIALFWAGIGLGRAIGVSVGLGVVNSLPYGDSTPAWLRPVVFASYALPSAWLSTKYLLPLLLVSAGFLSLWFWLSRKIQAWTWTTWEALSGLIQASSLIIGCLANG